MFSSDVRLRWYAYLWSDLRRLDELIWFRAVQVATEGFRQRTSCGAGGRLSRRTRKHLAYQTFEALLHETANYIRSTYLLQKNSQLQVVLLLCQQRQRAVLCTAFALLRRIGCLSGNCQWHSKQCSIHPGPYVKNAVIGV